jgi:hypothetical protein
MLMSIPPFGSSSMRLCLKLSGSSCARAIEETPEHEVVVDDKSIEGRALPIKVKTALQNKITIVRFAES